MTQSPLILIHAGMRPGDLILAHSDGRAPVFLPASDRVHFFEVAKNTQAEQWAIIRRYAPGGAPDALLTFDTQDDAQRALVELHKALLEPAPAQETRTTITLPENWKAIGAAVCFIFVVAVLSYCGKKPSDPISPTPAAEAAAAGYTNGVSTYAAPTYQDVGEASPQAPAETAPPTNGSVSPGDSLLQQIQGPGATKSLPATAPQAPPASAGDALLQQIQGQ